MKDLPPLGRLSDEEKNALIKAQWQGLQKLRAEIEKLRTYAANFLNAVYSVEIPPTPLDKGGGDSRGDLQRH